MKLATITSSSVPRYSDGSISVARMDGEGYYLTAPGVVHYAVHQPRLRRSILRMTRVKPTKKVGDILSLTEQNTSRVVRFQMH